MDIGGTNGGNGFLFSELPLGFGMALAMNEPAMQGYVGLTESEKEHLILRCKDARSKAEMEKIVASLVPSESIEGIAAEESGEKFV